jgi:hypothetical protein
MPPGGDSPDTLGCPLDFQPGRGVWRSLVARFVRDEEAAGSNPVTPTKIIYRTKEHPLTRVFFAFWCTGRCTARQGTLARLLEPDPCHQCFNGIGQMPYRYTYFLQRPPLWNLPIMFKWLERRWKY